MQSRKLYFLTSAIVVIALSVHAQGQAISQDASVPVAYGLVVDNSGSLRSHLNEVVEAGKFIVNGGRPADELFIVRFTDSEGISILQDFTRDKAAAIASLEGMYPEGGQSAIVDAIYFSAQHLSKVRAGGPASRRALILITDGDERSSFHKSSQLFELLREKGIKVYVIGVTYALRQHGLDVRKRAATFVNKVAVESGGRAYFPNSPTEVLSVAGSILEEIRKP